MQAPKFRRSSFTRAVMRLRLGRAASSVVNSLTVQLRLDLDLDLPLAGEEHAIGAGVEGGLAEEHEAAAGPGRLSVWMIACLGAPPL